MVFALGVTLINLLTGTYAFENVNDPEFNRFLAHPVHYLQNEISEEFRLPEITESNRKTLLNLDNLLSGMLDPDLKNRYSLQIV